MKKPHKGIVSQVRPITKGYYNEWLNTPKEKTEAVGFFDLREHDWSVWSGPEAKRKCVR